MKQVILNISDSSYEFFMELVSKLHFEPMEEENEIPEEVKKMVLERQKNFNRDKALTWEEVKAKLKY